MTTDAPGLTDHLVALALRAAPPPSAPALAASHSLFDWAVCGLAGMNEPAAATLRATALAEGAAPVASLIGGGRTSARLAALVNGTTSHALDYDDTHFAHIGHLSVGIYPAALAAGEMAGATIGQIVTAFLLGAEVAIRVGMALGPEHYDRGFHQTATAGAFGATAAAGRLLGLDPDRMRQALGLAATRASGIKNQFGSMGKPLNAGLAASNGVECALWAGAGMTSARDGLEGVNGFLATHSDRPDPAAGLREDFLFDAVKYKLHACCHGTHAMLEALQALPARPAAAEVAALHLRTSPRWLNVCDIKTPRSGLEVKFSYAWLAAMALSGIPTAADCSYTDAIAGDPALARLAGRVVVTADDGLSEMQASGEIVLTGGERLPFRHDLDQPFAPEISARSLRRKAGILIGAERADRLWNLIRHDPDTRDCASLGASLGAMLGATP